VVQDSKDYYLSLLHHLYLLLVVVYLLQKALLDSGVSRCRVDTLALLLLQQKLEWLELLRESLFILLANVESVVDLKVDGVALGLFDLFVFKELNDTLCVVDLRVEEECHVVHRLRLAVLPINAVVSDVIESHLHVFHVPAFSHVHKRWHQLWNVDVFVCFLLQFCNGFRCTLVYEDRSVPQHGFVTHDWVLDVSHLLQSSDMILLVDVVHDDCVVPLDELGILYALIDLAVALQHLENGFLVDVVLVFRQEVLECLLLDLVSFVKFFSLFGLVSKVFAAKCTAKIVDFVEFELHNPSAQKHLLRFDLLLVRLFADDIKHFGKVVNQVGVEVFLDEPESDFLESLIALSIEVRCLLILLLQKQLVRIDASDVWLLRRLTVFKCMAHLTFLEVLLPSIFLFIFQG
jgi:hypothetical protein